MGRYFDSDSDSVKESYQYNTELENCVENNSCETGDYSVWATANMLISMVFPDGSPEFLNELFSPENPAFKENLNTKVSTAASMRDVTLVRVNFSTFIYLGPFSRLPTCDGVQCHICV